jgi:short-subunit dehydrogenase
VNPSGNPSEPATSSATGSRPLLGKTVVVTGGSSGNGRAIALECAWRGANVVIAARTPEMLEAVRLEIEALGATGLAIPTDVTDLAQVERLANAALEHFGQIDVWVNNAGGAFFSDLASSPPELIHWLIDLNVYGVIHGVRAVVPIMRRQGFGHVVNVASIAGRVGFPRMGLYCATKAFVEVYTQSLRQELMHVERTGIKVSAVLPVVVRTPFFDKAPNTVEGSPGAYLVAPYLEPGRVARAVADGLERYRPVILPFAPAKFLAILYDILPGASDWLLSWLRPDRPVGPLTSRTKGSHRDRRPIGPFVRDGRLEQS